MANAVACPLSGCSEEHQLREARNRRKSTFIACQTWGGTTVWFRSPTAQAYLANGGVMVVNPTLPAPGRVEDDGQATTTYSCPKCNHLLDEDETPCPSCNETIEWMEQNDKETEEELY